MSINASHIFAHFRFDVFAAALRLSCRSSSVAVEAPG